MATSLPTTSMALEVRRAVRPVRRALALTLVLRWSLRCLAPALLAIAVLAAIAHLTPWPDADPLGGYRGWIAVPLALAVLATFVLVARQWPGEEQAIRQTDHALALKDRLATAHEFSTRDSPIARLQRDELRSLLPSIEIRRAARLVWPTRELFLAGGAALLLLGAALAPNPQDAALARRHQQQAIARHAATRAAAAIVHLRQSTPLPVRGDQRNQRTLRQAEDVLRRLQSQLAQAGTPAQALKALTAAQQALQRLAVPGIQAQKTVQALARALAGGSTGSLASALRSGNSAATKQALSKLSRNLPGLSKAQRADLARKLEQAANSAPGPVADQLRQAAFNLSDTNLAAAQQSLQSAAQSLQDAQNTANAAKLAQQAQQQLQSIKQDVANGVTGNQPRTATSGAGKGAKTAAGPSGHKAGAGQPKAGKGVPVTLGQGAGRGGARQGSGQGQGKGSGKGAGKGAGLGQGSGQGNGSAAALGSGQGSGSAGGHGSGGNGGPSGGNGAGKYESVYLPGQRQGGPSVVTNGPLGRAVPVQSQAFRQMLPRYSSAADTSLGRTALPPALQAAVKRYFQALGQ